MKLFSYKVKKLKVGDINNYSYIIKEEFSKNSIIIDPAWDLNKIIEFLKKEQAVIKAILLTHSHYDHTNLVNKLVKLFNCQVYISQEESNYYNFKCNNLKLLKDSEILKIGNLQFKCLLTPGHTVGSMCFKLENNLFTGDTIFLRGCGLCNCRGGDCEQMFESIKRIKEILTKETLTIYPGHYFKNDFKYKTEYLKRNIYFHINSKNLFKKVINMNIKKNDYLKYE